MVHFGPGAFHRAHQAVYLQRLFEAGHDHDWALVGAGVRPEDAVMGTGLVPNGTATSDGPTVTYTPAAGQVGADSFTYTATVGGVTDTGTINVTINPMEVGAILEDWRNGDYQMAVVGGVWRPDPSNEVSNFYSQSSFGQGMGINDPDLDALIEQGLAETDPEAREEIYRQIQEHALEQVYIIVPYTYPLRWELLWDYVKGYDVMASNARISVRKTWLDQ